MAGGTSPYASPLVTVRSYDEVSATDSHDSYHQIALGIEGGLELEVDHLATCVAPTLGVIVPVGARHDYLGIGANNRQLIVDVPVDALTLPRQLFDRPSLIPIDAAFAQWVVRLAQLRDNPDRFAHWQATARLCDAVLERMSGAGHPNPERFTLARVDAYLRAHLAEPLSIAALASFCGCGVRSFHDRFVAEFGITPHRYLLRLRVEQAARMMNERRRSLADIALACGFADQSAMTHAFAARFGMPPGRWRGGDAVRPGTSDRET
ncbi:AraC family transcriptional regulator [Pararobbsia silviterrae]|uniref:AraC family transcriptional regulator n=1 Tax=Pararobbsia silviterrae TaxID=1792498 RepID=A0A494Y7H5_9BURK|nr:AraC family transcriptional regulator [Pararobbsia silviterrae]RKP57507.1 AraC family transcriptional regulator [Pararobbsia silviterrae]